MNHEKSLFDDRDEKAEAAADARAERDVQANRLIGHAAMREWFRSWGSPNRTQRPSIGD